jgi:nitroreductase
MIALEIIKKRISVRSFNDRPIEVQIRRELEEYCRDIGSGPFGAAVRFKLLDLDLLSRQELRPLGTYGVIKGAHHFILGAVKEGKGSLEDIGYCMEKIILKATSLGLGTCWLGGTYKRSAFAAKMNLTDDEMLPAITPVGYPAKEITYVDSMFRFGSRSRNRKQWNDLFFRVNKNTTLPEAEAGEYRQVLEAVRMGPSASNHQPWRIVKDDYGIFHLFLKENGIYNRMSGKYRLQYIDMGIAMCHFEVAARELGLPGNWEVNGPVLDIQGLKHIAAWKE